MWRKFQGNLVSGFLTKQLVFIPTRQGLERAGLCSFQDSRMLVSFQVGDLENSGVFNSGYLL